jgi:hypothetical protein
MAKFIIQREIVINLARVSNGTRKPPSVVPAYQRIIAPNEGQQHPLGVVPELPWLELSSPCEGQQLEFDRDDASASGVCVIIIAPTRGCNKPTKPRPATTASVIITLRGVATATLDLRLCLGARVIIAPTRGCHCIQIGMPPGSCIAIIAPTRGSNSQ